LNSGPYISLGEIVQARYGKALREDERDSNGSFDVFGSSGIVGNHSSAVIDQATIIVGRKGSVGAVTYAPNGGWPIDTTYYLTWRDGVLGDWRYLFHALSAANLGKHEITTSIPGLNRDRLLETLISFPNIVSQRHIGAMLDKADAIRQNRRDALKLADQFMRSVFLDMFGDPVPNPKGWQTAKLGTITKKIGSGATPLGGDSVYKTSGISFIRSLNVHDRKFLIKDLAHLDTAQAARLANVEVMSGDVLLNITGASVARCCLVPEDVLPARVNQHVSIIRPNERINSEFLESHLVCETVKRVLLGIGESMGATRQAITKAQLEAFPIIVPPIPEQERFVKVVAKVRQQKQAIEEFATQSEILFQSIQQQAFA